MEHPNCLVLKEKQKSFLQEQEYEAGWGKIDMLSFITSRNLLWFIPAPFSSWFSLSWKHTQSNNICFLHLYDKLFKLKVFFCLDYLVARIRATPTKAVEVTFETTKDCCHHFLLGVPFPTGDMFCVKCEVKMAGY